MTDFSVLKSNLVKKGYKVSVFSTGKEAADYLDGAITGKAVGVADSQTLEQIGIYSRLCRNNTVFTPAYTTDDEAFYQMAVKCLLTDVFLVSANGISLDGTIVNLDSSGNRIAASLYGHQKVYYVIGRNKIAESVEGAVWRVRNIAAPQNAKRLHMPTPCAVTGKCHDCNSPERICNGLLILLHKIKNMEIEIVLVDEDLGL